MWNLSAEHMTGQRGRKTHMCTFFLVVKIKNYVAMDSQDLFYVRVLAVRFLKSRNGRKIWFYKLLGYGENVCLWGNTSGIQHICHIWCQTVFKILGWAIIFLQTSVVYVKILKGIQLTERKSIIVVTSCAVRSVCESTSYQLDTEWVDRQLPGIRNEGCETLVRSRHK